MRNHIYFFNLILCLLFFNKINAQNVLVTKTNDTIRFSHNIVLNDSIRKDLQPIKLGEKQYPISKITYLKYQEKEYLNCGGVLYIKVSSNKINVYAFKISDTTLKENEKVSGKVYIQDSSGIPYALSIHSLRKLLNKKPDLMKKTNILILNKVGGVLLVALGSPLGGISTLASVFGSLNYYNDDDPSLLKASFFGMGLGIGMIKHGTRLQKKGRYTNLNPVYQYNSQ